MDGRRREFIRSISHSSPPRQKPLDHILVLVGEPSAPAEQRGQYHGDSDPLQRAALSRLHVVQSDRGAALRAVTCRGSMSVLSLMMVPVVMMAMVSLLAAAARLPGRAPACGRCVTAEGCQWPG